jgi:hypothetical protein
MIGFIKVCIQNPIILYYVTASSDTIELQHTTMTSDPIDMPPGSIRTHGNPFCTVGSQKNRLFSQNRPQREVLVGKPKS